MLLSKKDYSYIYGMKKILNHLNKAKNDKRDRERRRAKIALSYIWDWIMEGEEIYEEAEQKRILPEDSESSC